MPKPNMSYSCIGGREGEGEAEIVQSKRDLLKSIIHRAYI